MNWDEALESIVSLGYTTAQAEKALVENEENVDDAIDWLFTKGRVKKRSKKDDSSPLSSDYVQDSWTGEVPALARGDHDDMPEITTASGEELADDELQEIAHDYPSTRKNILTDDFSSSYSFSDSSVRRESSFKSQKRSERRRDSVVRFADSESAPLDFEDDDEDGDDDERDHAHLESFRRRSLHNVPLVELSLKDIVYAPMTSTASAHALGRHKQAKSRKVVLDHVTTRVTPFQLSAWMGPSGSGKTSLITVAAGLYELGDLQEGSIVEVNDEEGSIPKRLVGVVWQDDLLLGNLTVEETIYFSAKLKTPSSTPDSQVQLVVQESMEELGLLHIRDSMIGSTTNDGATRGISGGERKRVSVASELVIRPSVLFLDEPTSGLDSTSAQLLMQTLKHLAVKGHAIAVVIHQPRTAIFNMLDNLLLLSRGKVVYNGKACNARAYLESCPSLQDLPPETGIADWIMDVIKEDEKNGNVLPDYWNENKSSVPTECTEHLAVAEKVSRRLLRAKSSLAELRAIPKFETSFWVQLRLLTNRVLKQQRGEKVTRVNLLLTLTYIIFTGFFWWRLPNDTGSIYNRNSLLFFMLIAQSNGIVISSVNTFQRERALLSRERAKKMFGVLPFFIAKTASDMTNNVLLPVVYGMVSYWVGGLRPTAAAFFKFTLSFYMTLSTAQSMGLFLSVAIPSMTIALILAPPITLFFILMGGFYIPFDSMNAFIWGLSWLSFARYGYSSFLINEYEGREIPCSDDDSTFMIGGDECPVSGDSVLADLGITGEAASNFWFNVLIVLAMQIVFRVASYALLRRSK